MGVHHTSTAVTVGTASAVAAVTAAESVAAAAAAVTKAADGSSQETQVFGVPAAPPAAAAHVSVPAVVNMAAPAAEPLKDVSLRVLLESTYWFIPFHVCAFLIVGFFCCDDNFV